MAVVHFTIIPCEPYRESYTVFAIFVPVLKALFVLVLEHVTFYERCLSC